VFPNKEFERTKSDIPMTGDQRSVDFVNSLAMIYEENKADSFGEKTHEKTKLKLVPPSLFNGSFVYLVH